MLPYSRQEAPGLSPNQARASFEAPGDSFFPSAGEDAASKRLICTTMQATVTGTDENYYLYRQDH